jgi:protocatechuate 3,4-dioxygenase beta subunit
MARLTSALAVFVLLAASAAYGQQGTSDLRGQVVDQQGAALPGATVVVRHQESGRFRETTSGADGSFFLSAIIPRALPGQHVR